MTGEDMRVECNQYVLTKFQPLFSPTEDGLKRLRFGTTFRKLLKIPWIGEIENKEAVRSV